MRPEWKCRQPARCYTAVVACPWPEAAIDQKPTLSVKFDDFVNGQELYGLEKIVLKDAVDSGTGKKFEAEVARVGRVADLP
jgi:hypothetical protein